MNPGTSHTTALADVFAGLITLGIDHRDTHLAVLKAHLEAHPELLGTWCVWELEALGPAAPHAPGHDPSGRFVPYWHRARGYPKLEPVTGYANRRLAGWYWIPKKLGISCLVDPFIYPVDGHLRLISSEVSPILLEGRCLGVVGIDRLINAHPAGRTPTGPRVHHRNPPPLTGRERQVLHWLKQAKTNDEIAVLLGISPHTVKNHLAHLFAKLGVENRYAAMIAGN